MILVKKLIKRKQQHILIVFLNGQILLMYSRPFLTLFHNFINKTRYDFYFENIK
jgi:hypothetical protein